MSAVVGERIAAALPLAAGGWVEAGRVSWLPLFPDGRLRPLAARLLPPLTPGTRLERRLGPRRVLHAVAVGPEHALLMITGPRGYLPPLAQRAALTAAWERRLRYGPGGPPAAPSLPEPDWAAPLRSPTDVLAARRRFQELAAAGGFLQPGDIRACVAATEAMVNAVRHGGGGCVRVLASAGRLAVEVEDRGPGLPFARLAWTLLAPRDAGSLCRGYGFWLMLAYARTCTVLTGPLGTRVVLEFAAPRGP